MDAIVIHEFHPSCFSVMNSGSNSSCKQSVGKKSSLDLDILSFWASFSFAIRPPILDEPEICREQIRRGENGTGSFCKRTQEERMALTKTEKK
jgi:hypothetical protein